MSHFFASNLIHLKHRLKGLYSHLNHSTKFTFYRTAKSIHIFVTNFNRVLTSLYSQVNIINIDLYVFALKFLKNVNLNVIQFFIVLEFIHFRYDHTRVGDMICLFKITSFEIEKNKKKHIQNNVTVIGNNSSSIIWLS